MEQVIEAAPVEPKDTAIVCAHLDADNTFIGMVTLANEGQLTDRHLRQITECDLPIGLYRWIADEGNAYGGAFWPIKMLNRMVESERILAARH